MDPRRSLSHTPIQDEDDKVELSGRTPLKLIKVSYAKATEHEKRWYHETHSSFDRIRVLFL